MSEKTVGDRVAEMRAIYEQLETYGLTDRFEGVREFKKIANLFVREGQSASGKIPLEGIDRNLEYVLSMNPKKDAMVVLRHRDSNNPRTR